MRIISALAVLFLVTSCAPATTSYDPAEGARAFTLTVDGERAERSGGGFTFRSEAFDLDIVLERRRVRTTLVNNTDSTLRLIPDRSAFVLPDGSSSNVITGSVSWATRNDPQPNIVIPEGAATNQMLTPRSHLGFSSRLFVDPMFEWPLTSSVTIRLLLSMEIQGDTTEVVLQFDGNPLEE